MLESWAPASSLTNFKLAWKTATILALATAKCCSDLTLLCIDYQHLFLQHHAAIFVPASGGKMDWLGYLPPQICVESDSSVNLCPIFYVKAYLQHTEPLRKKSNGSWVSSLLLGNNRHNMPVCTKMISSWVRKILSIAKVHIPRCCPKCCSFGGLCYPGFHPARQVTRPEFLCQLDTSFPHVSLLQISSRIPYSVLNWDLVSRLHVAGKCKTLAYRRSCSVLGCWSIALPNTEQIVSQLSVWC